MGRRNRKEGRKMDGKVRQRRRKEEEQSMAMTVTMTMMMTYRTRYQSCPHHHLTHPLLLDDLDDLRHCSAS